MKIKISIDVDDEAIKEYNENEELYKINSNEDLLEKVSMVIHDWLLDDEIGESIKIEEIK